MRIRIAGICLSLIVLLPTLAALGCSSLSLSELQTPRTGGQGELTARAGIDYGPSLALLYDNPGNRVHRVPRASLLPPLRAGITYGLTDRMDVGANVWSAGYWSAIFLLSSWDVGGQVHCKYMLTPRRWDHSLAIGLSGFGYAGLFRWGQDNPFEVEARGNALGFNPLLLYGYRFAADSLQEPEIYLGLRAYLIDYHVEGEVEHFRTAPPPTYESHDGTARFLSPLVGIKLTSGSFDLFIEAGAFIGENPFNNRSPLTSFTLGIGIAKSVEL